MKNEKLTFTCGEGGEAEEFFVVEQTRLNGVTYLLVADSEEDDAECLILKDTSAPEEKDSVYEMVEEEVELNAVLKVFEELLEDEVICTLRFIKEDGLELPARVTFFQGLPKADKMEFIVQKLVELGAYRIVPVTLKRSVVHLDEKKAKARQARWQSIAEAAAKQSKRRIVPEVGAVCTLKEALEQTKQMDLKLIPYELSEGMTRTKKLIESAAPGQEIGVFIGPEGGFEEAEVELAMQSGFMPVTLGKRILRTETAGLTVMAWLMYQLEDSGIS